MSADRPTRPPWTPEEPSFFELHPSVGHTQWVDEDGNPPEIPGRARRTPRESEKVDLGIFDVGLLDEPIPPRQWLLGNLFCRGFLSSLLGDGATGKTAYRVACALALAADRGDIIDEKVFQRCKVLYLSFEDGRDEIRRRLSAAMQHHNVSRSDVQGYLFVAAISRHDLKLASQRRNGELVPGLLGPTLREQAAAVDVVILDPFVKTHSVNENDNSAMDQIADILASIAIEEDLAIDYPHHTKKGPGDPGNADQGRGASAVKDAGRLVYTLSKMTEKEGEHFGVSDFDRRYLVRHDSAKVNIAPPTTSTKWLRLVDVSIGNGNVFYPHGDHVQTVEIWRAKDLWADLSNITLNVILDDIDRGIVDAGKTTYYSAHPQSKERAAWRVVQVHAGQLTDHQAMEIIAVWVKNGVLYEVEFKDRRIMKGVRVNSAKRPS